ncbi:hypothetical protein [Anatilimnocola floriformis]|uniref:hypothetical protein n=1 Tax=Anatilimnocola floriformis TaxID=2948575 RepID=UPI0020C5A549|nr:hypothetical protein [Anatilimnocola floriformis]
MKTKTSRALVPTVVAEHMTRCMKTRGGGETSLAQDSADGCTDMEIPEGVGLCERQVVRVRQKYVKSGVHSTLVRVTREDARIPKVIDDRAGGANHHHRLYRSAGGRDHWTLQLLCTELKRLKVVKSVCPRPYARRLRKQMSAMGSLAEREPSCRRQFRIKWF